MNVCKKVHEKHTYFKKIKIKTLYKKIYKLTASIGTIIGSLKMTHCTAS